MSQELARTLRSRGAGTLRRLLLLLHDRMIAQARSVNKSSPRLLGPATPSSKRARRLRATAPDPDKPALSLLANFSAMLTDGARSFTGSVGDPTAARNPAALAPAVRC